MSLTPPVPHHRFQVEIDGIAFSSFAEAAGLEVEHSVIEYREGGDKTNAVRKIPGLTKYTNITLKRGISTDLSLWQWFVSRDRRNGTVMMLNDQMEPVLRFRFRNGFVAKWTGPELNACASGVAFECVEIAHEGLEVEAL